jgi:hypothetical protein
MKKIVLIIFLLLPCFGFSQKIKDSLLLSDKEKIKEKLDLMFYLDRCSTEYWKKTKEERIKSDKAFSFFYSDTILKNNPTSLNIKEYLGLFSPLNWKGFMEAVYEKNISEYIVMTEKYGYLSYDRMDVNINNTDRTNAVIVFVMRSKSHDKIIKKLIKQEKKISNMPQRDYDYYKFVLERKSVITKKDIEKLKRKDIELNISKTPL